MTQVGRARKTLLRKHITKKGAVVQTSKVVKYHEHTEEDDNSNN